MGEIIDFETGSTVEPPCDVEPCEAESSNPFPWVKLVTGPPGDNEYPVIRVQLSHDQFVDVWLTTDQCYDIGAKLIIAAAERVAKA